MKAWKWLSYLFPVSIKKIDSPVNGVFEVNWENGRKVLNTKHANYSFGSLHKVFQKALAEINYSANAFSSCLILGFGAGSIYSILRDEYKSSISIVGIELDKTYQRILPEFIPELSNTKMVYTDAVDYLHSNSEGYPLILCDLFVDSQTLGVTLTNKFIKDINKSLEEGGVYIHNTMFKDKGEQMKYFMLLERVFDHVLLKEFFGSNSVFICTKSKKTNPE